MTVCRPFPLSEIEEETKSIGESGGRNAIEIPSKSYRFLRQRFQIFRWQWQRFVVVTARFDQTVCVVLQQTMRFLVRQRSAFHFHRTKPCPGQWGWIFVTFQEVPDIDALLVG